MKLVEILTNNESVFLETEGKNKKLSALVAETNALLANLYSTCNDMVEYTNSQLSGEKHNLIVAAKSLENYYQGNKVLKVETLVAGLKKEESDKLAQLAGLKNKVLANLNLLAKTTKTEAVTSNYDIFDGDLTRCQEGHEVIILGEHGQGVIESLIEQVTEGFVVEGNFDNVGATEYQFSMDTVESNVSTCESRANELFPTKPDKVNKYMALAEKMVAAAKEVVAFYTAKDTLVKLGCNPKALKTYEAALQKAYIPYKKSLEKDLKCELLDICAVEVNEDAFPTSEEMPVDPMTTFTETASTELSSENTVSDEEYSAVTEAFTTAAETVGEEANVVEETPAEDSNPFAAFTETNNEEEPTTEEPTPSITAMMDETTTEETTESTDEEDGDLAIKSMSSKLSALKSSLQKMTDNKDE